MTCEEACTRHKVTAQSELDDMEAQRRRKLEEGLPAKKAAADKARKEEREAVKVALEVRMQTFRDGDATEEEVVRAGRQLLRDRGCSEKEIEECKVDMDRVFASDRWWEEESVMEGGDVDMDEMDTSEAMLALPRTQKYLADRKRARTSREASAAGSERAQSMDMSS